MVYRPSILTFNVRLICHLRHLRVRVGPGPIDSGVAVAERIKIHTNKTCVETPKCLLLWLWVLRLRVTPVDRSSTVLFVLRVGPDAEVSGTR